MENKKTGWKPKLLMLAVSSFFVIALLGLGEIYCRLFTRINFLDNSRGLFTYNRFGNTYGNTPNFEGISFGEKFYTDKDGFRVEPGALPGKGGPATLVMGDSVAFGPALPERETISGNLRSRISGKTVYNGAAIGYDTFDQRNAALGFVNEHPEIKTVVVIFCLNDVSDASAQLIRSQTQQAPVEESSRGSVARRVNDYLRSRSKLFLWLKNAVVDTQMVYFRNDLANYQRGEANVHAALKPITELRDQLAHKGVTLRVFITPYEAQLRADAPAEYMEPQRIITEYFAASGIDHYDTTPDFRAAGGDPKRFFLYGDPMHLSAEGANIVADAISRARTLSIDN